MKNKSSHKAEDMTLLYHKTKEEIEAYRANFKMFNFAQGQERRKFWPQEYLRYFESRLGGMSLTSRRWREVKGHVLKLAL